VVYALFSEFIAYLLRKKRLSHRTSDYKEPGMTVPPPAPPRKETVPAEAEVKTEKSETAEKK